MSYTPNEKNIIIVTKKEQLTGALDSSKAYLIDGVIDMGSSPIIVPVGGLTILGIDFNISGLTSTANNYSLFTSPGGSYSGNLNLRNIYFAIGGTSSQVFNITNAGNNAAVEITDTNFLFCTSVGEITAYRQLLCTTCGFIGCVEGITLSGTWSGGAAIVTSILVSAGVTFNGTILKAGTALSVLGSVRSDMNALQIGASGAVCDFAPSNIAVDGAFLMTGVRSNPAATAFPNMPASSVKALFRNCSGTDNTYIGGAGTITTTATTTITTADTAVVMAGTGTLSELVWFSAYSANGFEYISTVRRDVSLAGSLSFSGTTNDQVALVVYKYTAATTSWAAISPDFTVTMNAGGASNRAENISFSALATMDDGDRIQLYVKNVAATNDITTVVGGQYIVKER
tara:strand:+ start:27067 stop:28266 length:1200 start_codon:yes stop_codon:yes gene_type:complete